MATQTDERLSAMVAEAAEQLGLTQTALANIAGLHRVPLADRIAGRTSWKLAEVTALARVLGLDLHTLLEDEAA